MRVVCGVSVRFASGILSEAFRYFGGGPEHRCDEVAPVCSVEKIDNRDATGQPIVRCSSGIDVVKKVISSMVVQESYSRRRGDDSGPDDKCMCSEDRP